MNKEEFKDRLKKAIDLRNMKAVDLCEKTKIPKGAISYYLAGKSTPKADRLYLICKALDVSEAWMLGYDVEMERTQTQKNNDAIADIVVRLNVDSSFLSIVNALANDKDFFAAVESIHTLASKANEADN